MVTIAAAMATIAEPMSGLDPPSPLPPGAAARGGGRPPPPSLAIAAAMGRPPPQEENLYCYCSVCADPYVNIYEGDPGGDRKKSHTHTQ